MKGVFNLNVNKVSRTFFFMILKVSPPKLHARFAREHCFLDSECIVGVASRSKVPFLQATKSWERSLWVETKDQVFMHISLIELLPPLKSYYHRGNRAWNRNKRDRDSKREKHWMIKCQKNLCVDKESCRVNGRTRQYGWLLIMNPPMRWSIIVVESFPCRHQNQSTVVLSYRKCPKINCKWMRMTFTWPRSDFAWEKDLVRMIAFQHLRFLQIIETLKSAIFQPLLVQQHLFFCAQPDDLSQVVCLLLPWNSGFWMGFSHLCFFECLGSSVFYEIAVCILPWDGIVAWSHHYYYSVCVSWLEQRGQAKGEEARSHDSYSTTIPLLLQSELEIKSWSNLFNLWDDKNS